MPMTKVDDETPKRKYMHYSHSPFSVEVDGVKADVNKNGKITITQSHDDDTYDEIKTSVRFILKLNKMIRANRHISYKDTPFKEDND